MDQPSDVVRSAARRAVARLAAERGLADVTPPPTPGLHVSLTGRGPGGRAVESTGTESTGSGSGSDPSNPEPSKHGRGGGLVTLDSLRSAGPLLPARDARWTPLALEEAMLGGLGARPPGADPAGDRAPGRDAPTGGGP